MASDLLIRPVERRDGPELLALMRALALFEGYADQFCVAEADLDQRLFTRRDFHVLVAESGGKLAGMVVYYFLPFTYDLKPWLYVKELYVETTFRNSGTGVALMREVARQCVAAGGSRIKLEVLADNAGARRFYARLGAASNAGWETCSFHRDAIDRLAQAITVF